MFLIDENWVNNFNVRRWKRPWNHVMHSFNICSMFSLFNLFYIFIRLCIQVLLLLHQSTWRWIEIGCILFCFLFVLCWIATFSISFRFINTSSIDILWDPRNGWHFRSLTWVFFTMMLDLFLSGANLAATCVSRDSRSFSHIPRTYIRNRATRNVFYGNCLALLLFKEQLLRYYVLF